MELCYTDDELIINNRKSIFLAGPTPRSKDVKSWRPEALEALKENKFDGVVYVPEYKDEVRRELVDRADWERRALSHADIIMFWVSRELKDMPAFTTNVEFGYWIAKTPKKIVYGRPKDAPKTKYLDWLYKKETNKEAHSNIKLAIEEAISLI